MTATASGPQPSLRTAEMRADAARLIAQPGEWVRIGTYPTSGTAKTTAYHIRKGRLVAYRPAGDFDATARGTDVWARYLGDPDAT